MPKPDKKTNKEPNLDYSMLMGLANDALSGAYYVSLGKGSTGKEGALDHIAMALAYAELAEERGFEELPKGSEADTNAFEEIKGKAGQKAKRIKNTAEFEAVLGRMSQHGVCGGTGPRGRYGE